MYSKSQLILIIVQSFAYFPIILYNAFSLRRKGVFTLLKIFSTQLTGVFKNISNDEFYMEDAARLLAQAVVGDGSIYIHGFQEMQGITNQAIDGIEPMPNCKPLPIDNTFDYVSAVDRVLIISRYSDDQEAIKLAEDLYKENIPFVAISTILDDQKEGIHTLADVHINLRQKRGLVPTETGERVGFPSLLTALYAFHGIQLTLNELLEELQE